jgi:flagellar motility protein MotE (MotC chaperone)
VKAATNPPAGFENYFNYFTEVEERYQKRRGTALLLSTLDWALIETWKDAGIPVEAVLRGIDETFDKYDRKPARAKTKKVNSLAYCSQEVLAAAQDMKEASTGVAQPVNGGNVGVEIENVKAYLLKNAKVLRESSTTSLQLLLTDMAVVLESLAASVTPAQLEDLERRLTVMEERLFATLLASATDTDLLTVRTDADRDIAPYRSKMSGAQIEQLHRQYVNKRLLERARLPRLSLFYM